MAAAFGDAFTLTLLTADPVLAAHADRAGVQRVGIDMERLGKSERQRGHDTRISMHSWTDLAAVGGVVRHSALFARVNPVHDGIEAEVEIAVAARASVLMLPRFSDPDEVARFVGAVRGRARVVILVEQAAAVARIREILAVPGVDEVMLGLNDLRLQFGVANHFEMLTSPVVDMLADQVRDCGLPLAIGGVGRVGDQSVPIPVDLVLAQYPRLGASGAWLSRSFCRATAASEFTGGVRALRDRLSEWAHASPRQLERARKELAALAAAWAPASSIPVSSAADVTSRGGAFTGQPGDVRATESI
jgi:citrate lyase beta subunit